MPQLDLTWFPAQIFWMAITFGLLFLLMWRLALPRVSNVLQTRQSQIQNDITRAEALKAEAEEMNARVDSAMEKARKEAQEILRQARSEIEADLARQEKETTSRINTRVQEGEEKVEKARRDALNRIRETAAEMAVTSAQKIGGISVDPEEAKKAVPPEEVPL